MPHQYTASTSHHFGVSVLHLTALHSAWTACMQCRARDNGLTHVGNYQLLCKAMSDDLLGATALEVNKLGLARL